MSKPKEGDILTFIPGNIVVTVVHVPEYHDPKDRNAVVIVQMKSGNTMPVPVSKLDKFLTTDPPKPPKKFMGISFGK